MLSPRPQAFFLPARSYFSPPVSLFLSSLSVPISLSIVEEFSFFRYVIDCFSQVLCLQGLPTGFGSQGSFACYLVERSSGTSNSALRLLWQKRSPSTYQAFPPSNFHLNIPGCCVLLNGRLHPCAESLSPSIYLPMGGEFVRDSGGGWFPLFNSWVPCPNSLYPLFFGLLSATC